MNKLPENEHQLIEAIHDLPGSMQPGNDLWPGIRSRLGYHGQQAVVRGNNRRMWTIAASVVLAFTAGILLGRQAGPVAGEPGHFVQQASQPAILAAAQAVELEYQAAFKGFIPVGVAPTFLGSEAFDDIEGSWNALSQAETALLGALNQYPDNPYLSQKLLDLRAQQLDFMRHLHMLDQNSRRNT